MLILILLQWKQRMLQSPLTRKSSRNASRTQTPTNSDSPVPSLGNAANNVDHQFRQKVRIKLLAFIPETMFLKSL